MPFLKPGLLSAPLSFLSGILAALALSSCSSPPDTIGCTPYVAQEWANYQAQFALLCGEDPACAPNLPTWKARVATWVPPSDSGTCVTWMSRQVFDVDETHPLPKEVAGGKPLPWTAIGATGIMLPAKLSVAPLETYIQSNCHNSSKCGDAGAWQGTIQATDKTLTTQSARMQALHRDPK